MRTPSKFTAERRTVIIGAVRAGLPRAQAAAKAGIHRDTLYEWIAKGEKTPEGQYGTFLRDLQTAEAEFVEATLGSWTAAIPDDWRAAMELLARRHPDDFAKRERHEVSGPKGEPIKVELQWPTGSEPPR